MPWDRVVGQARATDVLAHALRSGRVAHAYLFHGPAGSGKRAAALAFAQALQCERRGPGGPDGDACGVCLACTKAARLVHPDVHVYLPFPKVSKAPDKDDRPGDYAERLAALAEDPYAATDYRARARLGEEGPSNKQTEHRRRPVNELVRRELSFAPAEGRHVVGVLVDADRMREQAANAFLKLLEEPPPDVVLVLTAERLDAVLPTILSRCQRVRFDPLAPGAIEAALAARRVPPERAAFVARMADGSLTRALELVGSDELADHRRLALEFLRAAYTGRAEKIAPAVDAAVALGRERLKGWLGLVQTWVRDLVLARELGSTAPLVNVDQAEAVHAFVAHVSRADLGAMAGLLDEAERLVERNANAGLVLTTLALAFADAMRGAPAVRLYAPLDAAA